MLLTLKDKVLSYDYKTSVYQAIHKLSISDNIKIKRKDMMKKVISASRRCDVIATDYNLFLTKLESGVFELQNPFFKAKRYTVSVTPDDTHAIVLWSKDFSNFVKNQGVLKDYNLIFHYTINNYHPDIETVPTLECSMANLKWLFDNYTYEQVCVRYDPVFFQNNNNTLAQAMEERLNAFEEILINIVNIGDGRCRIYTSYIDLNKNIRAQLLNANIAIYEPNDMVISAFFKELNIIAKKYNFELFSCADKRLNSAGIEISGCINKELLDIFPNGKYSGAKDPSQRKDCLCIKSTDIGIYPDLDNGRRCVHQCKYCYVKGNII